ncbi:gamma-glutamyltranspeptidase/glutathione hydrolase [Roseiarcus fermentans]|uniref:Glutathione hydrolase proenzyme n=1 Tax=Roseiarcus fermentans TaxID=1473586 RepID=A0A366EPB9_9HYPH|nr:gamma-glutamyltransferase [Roseiarcus fermentans]RBP03530.1 gamma-glutamyltranspeptidase/glutathione hydrolase [Roseiarcus fermentans]
MRRAGLAVLACLLAPAVALADPRPIVSGYATAVPVVAKHGMVVTQEAEASRVGLDVLRRGGNAVDAAVAVGFALAVTLPRAGNLGGGGFMLIHRADPGTTIAIDYRETAPAATGKDVFLDANGEADPFKSRWSGLAVGVPGTVAGLELAWRKYGSGRFTFADLVAPAVALARRGLTVDDDLADSLPQAAPALARHPSAARIYLRPDGSPPQAGDHIALDDLAATLATIAREGAPGFYTGPVARRLVDAVQAAGGRMAMDDLAHYRAIEREPVVGDYRGHTIVSMPPPSSGGAHVIEILNILEGYDLAAQGLNSAAALHEMAEAEKLAYADRAAWLGDPDFVRIPLKGLTSKAYAAALRTRILPDRARPAADVGPGDPPAYESDQTTHFSIVDAEGDAVSNTYTLNFSYGSGLVADGTGVLLNNELDDFAARPGAPNAYGLLGGDANAPGPNRRPLSSMSPTIVLRNGEVEIVTGSPGGSRIITTVLQIVVDMIDHGLNVAEAEGAPRAHDQLYPDELRIERGVSADTVRLLEAMGHTVVVREAMGSANTIARSPDGVLTGASDPRQRGTLAVGY